MDKKVSLWQLFCACVKIGLILLGGRYVILPVMQSELVEKRGWITEEELVEFYALSQSLPGIIAINTSIFVGYKIREEYAKKRIVSQLPQEEKIAKSDIVVENNSTKEEFYKNIQHCLETLRT